MCPMLGRREAGASRAAQWLAVSGAVLFSCDGNMKDSESGYLTWASAAHGASWCPGELVFSVAPSRGKIVPGKEGGM